MDQIEQYVARTLESGVDPIELRFSPIYDCYDSRVIGYRGRTYINSILYGTLLPETCLSVLDRYCDLSMDLIGHELLQVVRQLSLVQALPPALRWISLQCPPSLLTNGNIYDLLTRSLFEMRERFRCCICLEFGEAILKLEPERVAASLADIRAAGCRTMLRNYGDVDFPMALLADLTPDCVLLNAQTVARLDDREKSATTAAFVRFAGGLGIEVIAEGVSSDAQIRELNAAECKGYLPSEHILYREMIRGSSAGGVKKIRVHDLRHSHASLLIELGFSPLLIAERLGHENIETTLNRYSHLYPHKQGELAQMLDFLQKP